MSKGLAIGVGAVLVGLAACGGYVMASSKYTSDLITQYRIVQDVTPGQSLEGKYEEVKVPSKYSEPDSDLVLDENKIVNSVAVVALHPNSAITNDVITEKGEEDRNFDFALPITVEGAIANSLKPGEMVAIKVKYKDNRDDAVVVPYIPVNEIRTSNGEVVQDEKSTPGFLMFVVSDDENIDLNNASKEGTLFVVRYKDLNGEKLEKTYKKGAVKSDSDSSSSTTSAPTPAN